ncbi:MAG: hypothetical protein COS84_00535 [Armatimonadetes bacterium CG07_land_8_20_14_0_80_40_9]|nr:MAG: hypothetical protein COS84_00535 [Armatimonadetes bacterium CG07_land_8_20_14_0_80_40_9]
MHKLNEQYIVDKKGNKKAAILEISEFEELLKKAKSYDESEEGFDCLDVNENIKEALSDIKEGRVRSAKEVLNEL